MPGRATAGRGGIVSSPLRIAAGTCLREPVGERTEPGLLELCGHPRRTTDVVVGVGGYVVDHLGSHQLERKTAHLIAEAPDERCRL